MKNITERKNFVLVRVILLATIFFVSTPMYLSAQPGRGVGAWPSGVARGGMIPGLRILDLTGDQREQIRLIRKRHSDAAFAQQHKAAKQALNEAITADVVNESAIRGLAAQLALFDADAAVQRAYLHVEVLQVLTPDQRAELSELQLRAKEFREKVRPLRRRSQSPL